MRNKLKNEQNVSAQSNKSVVSVRSAVCLSSIHLLNQLNFDLDMLHVQLGGVA